MTSEMKSGDVTDFTNFINAVIDETSLKNMHYINAARVSSEADIIAGGNGDKSTGFFIDPTIIVTENPRFITMEEEIFGPVMTVYIYEDNMFEETLRLCDETSPYGLTGAIFSNDKYATIKACRALRYAAGNFYINDKPTGAMVGQQPFGGSRASGTNDKAGSYLNLIRWVSPRTIKETLTPATDFRYPFME
jgi:1-pyrroline-5-carboxylate dehydrogenase